MAEIDVGGETSGGEGPEGTGGMDISSSADVLEDTAAEADLMSQGTEIEGTSSKLESIQQSKTEAIDSTMTQLQTKLGMEGTMDDAINDIRNNKTTPDTEKVKDYTETTTKGVKDYVKEEQAKNGEGGKDIKDSPKTKKSFMEKYGTKALIILGLAGIIAAGNIFKPKGIQNCYQMPTCGTGGAVQEIGCSQDTCNCANISACGDYPKCGEASSNCMYYYFQSLDTKTIIASLPAIAYSTYLAPTPPTSNTFLKVLIMVGILIAALAIIFFIYKLK
jgi:hypothetical protein